MQFQDFYFSTDNGLIETEYVFLKHNGFPQRFYELDKKSVQNPKQTPFHHSLSIGETGFGTGLNFLASVFFWLKQPETHSVLKYTAVEKYPLSQLQLRQVYTVFNKKWPQLAPICTALLDQYPSFNSNDGNSHTVKPSDIGSFQFELKLGVHKVYLNLLIGDATLGLRQLLPEKKQSIDAWYLDGFSPAKNREMWHMDLFETIAKLSKSGATLSTFTAASFVRQGLIKAGFTMHKAPGLGKKREILYGVKT